MGKNGDRSPMHEMKDLPISPEIVKLSADVHQRHILFL
jgi:hypothetical protein